MNLDPETILKNAVDIICPKCENNVFESVTLLKKISALVSPNGQEMILPVPAYRCTECLYVLQNDDIKASKSEQPVSKLILNT